MKKELTASIVFSSISVFENFERQLHMAFNYAEKTVTGWVSLCRVNDFLHTVRVETSLRLVELTAIIQTELLDTFTETSASSIVSPQSAIDGDAIGFHNASFTWSSDHRVAGSFTPSKRTFTLRIEGYLFFPRGQVSLVVGPTASGKTSLLMALLGA